LSPAPEYTRILPCEDPGVVVVVTVLAGALPDWRDVQPAMSSAPAMRRKRMNPISLHFIFYNVQKYNKSVIK
jgi:hypothetical protein